MWPHARAASSVLLFQRLWRARLLEDSEIETVWCTERVGGQTRRRAPNAEASKVGILTARPCKRRSVDRGFDLLWSSELTSTRTQSCDTQH